jgi:hypothetical protein
MGKLLIIAGVLMVLIGTLVHYGVPLGRLPGDIVIRRGNFTLYVPLATGLLVSVVLTLLLAVVRR